MGSILTSIAANLKIQASITSSLPTVSGNTTVADQNNVVLAFGSAAGQADGVFTAVGNVSSGTPVAIDFTTLVDPMGNALTVAHVAAIVVTNTGNSSSGTIALGGGTHPLFAALPAALAITPGDSWDQTFNAAGLPVASGSTQQLTLTASAGTVPYRITALLRSM